jgi:hypothetical protein
MFLAIVFNNDASSTVEIFLTGLRDEEDKVSRAYGAHANSIRNGNERGKEKVKSPFPP